MFCRTCKSLPIINHPAILPSSLHQLHIFLRPQSAEPPLPLPVKLFPVSQVEASPGPQLMVLTARPSTRWTRPRP